MGITPEASDVVVVGAGLAGLSAALEAIASGASVAVLEKNEAAGTGGSSRAAGGLFAIPDGTDPDGRANYIEDFMKKSGGRANAETLALMADHVAEDIDWLRAKGVNFTVPQAFPPYRVHGLYAHPGQFQGMQKLIERLTQEALKRGCRLLFGTKLERLVTDSGGAVCGVEVTRIGGPTLEIKAGAVVLASGGYSANTEFLIKHVGEGARQLKVRGPKSGLGEGLRLAMNLGAATVNIDGLSSIHVAAVSAADPISGNPARAIPHCISINGEGERFVDESLGYVAHGKGTFHQKGQRVALVFGENLLTNMGVAASVDMFRRLGIDVIEADSLDDLANKIGVPADALARTIAEFNAAVTDGAAPTASPPKRAFADRIEGPQYYAFFPLVPGVTLSFGGVCTDTAGRVLKTGGAVIEGLYAAGEITGGEFFDDYIGGGSLVKCVVMGRVAGRSAARRSLSAPS